VTQLENTFHSIDEGSVQEEKNGGSWRQKGWRTKATMTGLGAHYIAWKRKQKPKQQTNKLTSLNGEL
jgi:hypothetical protein